MKNYPLMVENVSVDDYAVLSKGHHDKDEFMKKVREEGYEFPLGHPQHVWMKTTPTRNGDYKSFFNIVKEGTRGAWPATFAYEAYGDEQYPS